MEVPVFRPTLEESKAPWETYMTKIEPDYQQVGICKIIPPEGWKPCQGPVEEKDVTIRGPVSQELTGSQGLYQAHMQKKTPMSLQHKYKAYATDPDRRTPLGACPETIERKFWQSSHLSAPIYGADTEATFFDDTCEGWNLSKLDSLLTRGLKKRIPGVNTSYLYFGVWRSFFGWHTEDMDLHSVNYLHYGAPKQWYCIPPPYRARFEAYVKDTLSDLFRACPQFFRHKELLLSPGRLNAANIPFVKVVQYPGEMIVNSPGAYHAGFNTGFNCAEATNFATESWLKIGAKAEICECREDSVSIDMREFLRFAKPEVRNLINANFHSDTETDSEDESDGGEESEDQILDFSRKIKSDTDSGVTWSTPVQKRKAKPPKIQPPKIKAPQMKASKAKNPKNTKPAKPNQGKIKPKSIPGSSVKVMESNRALFQQKKPNLKRSRNDDFESEPQRKVPRTSPHNLAENLPNSFNRKSRQQAAPSIKQYARKNSSAKTDGGESLESTEKGKLDTNPDQRDEDLQNPRAGFVGRFLARLRPQKCDEESKKDVTKENPREGLSALLARLQPQEFGRGSKRKFDNGNSVLCWERRV